MPQEPLTGLVHSCETFGAADGPGVRFIVFLHGCCFRCRYCHNPDTWASEAAEKLPADAILARALRYRAYWGEKGGITVSGGEPMLQARFVAELFAQCRELGVDTCIDTCAGVFSRSDKDILRLLDLTDTVLLDIKHIDPERHRELTGGELEPVLDCARYLHETGKRVWLRHVLVPGWTDGEDELRKLAEFVRPLDNIERVDVLPYHVFGVDKWRRLGLAYPLEGVEPPTEASLAAARQILARP
ncbi:MAG: pyruvate formate lyase-activating protein [Kiritimatiellae bacterium]|nr:pyruvate formate lyase-activating protein [Kiritimatiellia bacterium]